MDPGSLGPAGRAALQAARDSLSAEALARQAVVVEAFVLAADVLAKLQAEHAALGFPLLVAGARGHVTGHPLLGELRRQANHLAEMAKTLGLTDRAPRVMTGRNLRAPDRLRRVK